MRTAVSFYFISLEKWELLHPVRQVHLTPWACGEPRRGLGNCTLIQQFNRPNPTQRNVTILKVYHTQVQLWPWVWPPPEQIVAIPCENICVLSLSLKPKLGKLSSRDHLHKCHLCLKYYVVVEYNLSEFWNSNQA